MPDDIGCCGYFTDQTKAGVAITSVALLSLVLLMAWGGCYEIQ